MADNKLRKLLYIFDHTDWKSRMPVAIEAQQQGWDVTIGIIGRPENDALLAGFHTVFLPWASSGFSPLAIVQMILALRRLVDETRADLVHTVTLKYAFLLGMATAFRSGYVVIYTLAGLGFLFRSKGLKPQIMRILLTPFLKFVLRDPKAHIIFQNPDDQKIMLDMGYVRQGRAHLVISSGVALDKFTASAPPQEEQPLVLMPTRLVREKGISVFIEAAQILKSKRIKARFAIAGGITKHNPRAISKTEMEEMVKDRNVEWLGRVEDMPALLKKAAIIVYPSYYGEGVPRVLLEAAAVGRPIITTDHPGCREAVDDRISGLLVPIKDANATAAAIESLLNDPKKRMEMGRHGRQKAESNFDIDRIVSLTADIYKKVIQS